MMGFQKENMEGQTTEHFSEMKGEFPDREGHWNISTLDGKWLTPGPQISEKRERGSSHTEKDQESEWFHTSQQPQWMLEDDGEMLSEFENIYSHLEFYT